MVSRPQEVPTDSEEIMHDTVNRREPLELSGRRETLHLALTLSCRVLPSSSVGEESLSPNHQDTSSRF